MQRRQQAGTSQEPTDDGDDDAESSQAPPRSVALSEAAFSLLRSTCGLVHLASESDATVLVQALVDVVLATCEATASIATIAVVPAAKLSTATPLAFKASNCSSSHCH